MLKTPLFISLFTWVCERHNPAIKPFLLKKATKQVFRLLTYDIIYFRLLYLSDIRIFVRLHRRENERRFFPSLHLRNCRINDGFLAVLPYLRFDHLLTRQLQITPVNLLPFSHLLGVCSPLPGRQ